MNLEIEFSKEKSIEERKVEIVERKGLGHPDTICDACCELASAKLSQYYLRNFGKVLHHNLDKGLLVGGKAKPKFGGGTVLKPIKLIIAGRATDRVGKKKINVEKICKSAVLYYLKKLEVSPKYFKVYVDYKPGAANLQEVFKRKSSFEGISNDTSFGIGFAPLSKTEKAVLSLSNFLNLELCKKIKAIGKDIKVMARRQSKRIYFTLAIAYIDKHISCLKEYFEIKEKTKESALSFLKKMKELKDFEISLDINVLDNENAKSEEDVYVTVTGLSAEQGDDGQVGRGNRINGLLTACREMSLEAACGKNIRHAGKLYQVLAKLIAEKIWKRTGKDCYVRMLSTIGKPLSQPQIVSVKMIGRKNEKIVREVKRTVKETLNEITKIQEALVYEKINLF